MARELNNHILNTDNNPISLGKNALIGTLTRSAKVESIHNIDWSTLSNAKNTSNKTSSKFTRKKEFTNQLIPRIPSETNIQLEADGQDRIKTLTPNANIPEQARAQLKELFETKYVSIISKSTTDIARTNLLELDISM